MSTAIGNKPRPSPGWSYKRWSLYAWKWICL